MIKVALVTTWNTACGIAEHSALLVDALPTWDLTVTPCPDALDPTALDPTPYDVVHLNYHAALHSRWSPAEVAALQEHHVKVVITYHDTMAGTEEQPNSDRAKALCHAADAFIVHEPVADLPTAIYWRQGVPAPEVCNSLISGPRPVVGTCGFDFPWKNYELLATASFEAGWAVRFVGGNISSERQAVLTDCNPHALFTDGFVPRRQLVSELASCDATAFLYLCANTGTSAAIRQGIAARRPMLATHPSACRQFRDLAGRRCGIEWMTDLSPANVTDQLMRVGAYNTGHFMDWVAEQDSWARLGAKYAALYRRLTDA